jgi:hypothetical protein
MDDILHVIVGGPRLDNDSIRYRRRRFAEYLCDQPNTAQLLWLYASPTPMKRIGRFQKLALPEMYLPHYQNKLIPLECGDKSISNS